MGFCRGGMVMKVVKHVYRDGIYAGVFRGEDTELTEQGFVEGLPLSGEEKAALRVWRVRQELDNQNSVNKVLLKIGFLQENRIRVLEGQPEITATQFRTWVDGQID